MRNKGYLEASLDSLIEEDSTKVAKLHIGPKYEWAKLHTGNVKEEVLDELGFRATAFEKDVFSLLQIQQLEEKLLTYSENNGYPFASVGLTAVEIENGQVRAALDWQKNQKIVFDSILVEGNGKISMGFLEQFSNIRMGDLYDESKILAAQKALQNLPYLQSSASPKVAFIGDRAIVTFFLKKAQASQFDVLLGLLSTKDEKTQLSGEGKIQLANPFGQGADYLLHYRNYPQQATELTTGITYPYFSFVPVGFKGEFDLFVKDTSYRNLRYKIGLDYAIKTNLKVAFFYENLSNRLINFNESRVVQTKNLPDNIDVDNRFYGIEVDWNALDYRLNPKKGWWLQMSVALGQRKLKRNSGILQLKDPNNSEFDFASLYEGIAQDNTQLKGMFTLERFWKLGKVSVLRTGGTLGLLRNLNKENGLEQTIYENERYRIGGSKILRGFDEQSVFVDWYNLLTVEYRYLIGQNSHVFAFTDFAYLSNQLTEIDFYGAYSFGAGIRFETTAGLFAFGYALGSQKGNPIQFQNGKVHLGYVGLF